MTTRRITIFLLAAFTLMIASAAPARADTDNSAEPECFRGTVEKVTDTALHLTVTTLPDDTPGKRDTTVLLDKETTYFDGTKKVNRAALQRGNIVLVFCKLVGKDRTAKIVRIIGGKKL